MSCFKLDILENLEPKLTVISKNSTSKKVRIVDFFATKKGVEDYYPFGMSMPNRNEGSSYRYGMNGMEKDDEIAGSGNSYTAEFWQYDSRLGRRWNIDPVVKPWESSYATFLENPIRVIDPNGDDGYVDEDGNHLGDDGSEDSHETRVIAADKWKEIVEGTKQGDFTDKMRETLQTNITVDDKGNVTGGTSKLLQHYERGIHISDDTWGKLTSNGGKRLQVWLYNKSDKDIHYKPEKELDGEDKNPYVSWNKTGIIPSGTELYSPVDGVEAPHVKKNQVFKVTDYHVVIVESNKVDYYIIMTDHPGDMLYKKTPSMAKMWLLGGWQGEGVSPDSGWDELLDKSNSK